MMSIVDVNKLKKYASQKDAWSVFYVDINNFGHFFWLGWLVFSLLAGICIDSIMGNGISL